MTQGLARLRYLAEHATFGLVLGASGLGKSALVKRFLHEVRGPACQPIYLHLTHLPSNGLLKLLVTAPGETPTRGKDRLFAQIVQRALYPRFARVVPVRVYGTPQRGRYAEKTSRQHFCAGLAQKVFSRLTLQES